MYEASVADNGGAFEDANVDDGEEADADLCDSRPMRLALEQREGEPSRAPQCPFSKHELAKGVSSSYRDRAGVSAIGLTSDLHSIVSPREAAQVSV